MTDMREKLANVITNAIIAESGEDPITLPDSLKIAWLDQGETDMGVVAQAAITALWPLAMEEADDAIKAAFIAGAMAVHENYQQDSDPEFGEAASDYLASLPPRKAPL